MPKRTNLVYEEVQQMGKSLPFMIVALLIVVVLFIIIYAKEVQTDELGYWQEWLIVGVLPSIILVSLYFLTLRTRIDTRGIHMRYGPFVKKQITWDSIARMDVINYGFVGGWGIRLWTSYGTVYNVAGNMGLAIECKSGKRLVIGTQDAQELNLVVGALKEQHQIDDYV